KEIVAGTPSNIGNGLNIQNLKCEYNDIDYILGKVADFNPVESALCFRELTHADADDLNLFYSRISEDDRDTLDLDFSHGKAFGVFRDHELASVACYFLLKDEPRIADITVVTANPYRGNGYGLVAVSKVVQIILSQGLFPRYRVNEHLASSVSIALKLGFKPRYQIHTYLSKGK